MLQHCETTCWMQTYTGKIFYPLEPVIADIDIEDIAAALSKQCRFGGHCGKFYSVAEHCCHVADYAPQSYKIEALLHDASEAYLVDIPRPIKAFMPEYLRIEDNLMKCITKRFDFLYPVTEVKEIDNRILSDERDQNMAFMDVEPRLWGNTLPALGVELQFWDNHKAKYEFMTRFHRWQGGR